MEDKQLTNQESLDLIARMITNTRRNFNGRGGSMFLIWGYTTIAVTIGVYFLFRATGSGNAMWAWWALPVVGYILTWIHYRKYERPVQTQMDKMVNSVWIVFAVACMACALFIFGGYIFGEGPYFNILFVIALMIGMSTAITGFMIKFRPVIIGGFLGIFLSFLIPVFNGMEQFFIFAGIFLVAQVIPGHLLNRACKKESERS